MTEWVAQAGQDRWAWELFGDGCYFVDVGAHDGISASNTYSLERDRLWHGVCIEPHEDLFRQCVARRSAICVPTAAAATAGTITAYTDAIADRDGYPTQAKPLADLLVEVGAKRRIDYLSVDVEGFELQVLEGMDFEAFEVGAITVEHNLYLNGPEMKQAIFGLLSAKGFERIREDVVAPGFGAYEDWWRACP